MVWNRKQNDPPEDTDKTPIPRQTLPKKLQHLVDQDEDFYDDLYSP